MDKTTHRKYLERTIREGQYDSLAAEDPNDTLLTQQDIGDLLAIAVGQHDIHCTESLLERGFNPNARNSDGKTPLTVAAESGSVAVIATLVNADAEIDMKSTLGISPLGYAARSNRPENARMLLEFGASVDIETQDRLTPLHLAAIGNADGTIPILIAHGAYVNCTDASGNTPLHFATHNGSGVHHNPAVKCLLECGADPELPNKKLESSLKCVSRYGKTELYMFEQLLKSVTSQRASLPR